MNENIFTINENAKFTFKSKDKDYLMRVNIVEGLILIDEINGEELKNKNIVFLGERESYLGEPKKDVEMLEVKKKKGRRKKK